MYAGQRVLVTGATGLIGSHLTLRLLGLGAEVHALVIPEQEEGSFLHSSSIAKDLRSHTGRLEDGPRLNAVVRESRPDVVFHLGAQTQVGQARLHPQETFQINVAGTWQLLEACRQLEPTPIVAIASSDKAYGRSDDLPYRETHPLAGTEPYEVSKSMTDLIAQTYAKAYGLRTRIARCGNVYGAGDFNWERIVPGTLRSVLRGERPVVRSDGSPIRDYIHVDDVVDAYLRLGSRPIGPGEPFNFSSGEHLTVLEVIDIILRSVGSTLEPVVRGDATGELAAQFLDSTKARRELEWQPHRRMGESMGEIIEWYRHA